MPAFSFWTVGHLTSANIIISNNLCCEKCKTIGVSYLHTWINVGLTTLGQFSLACLCLPKSFWTNYDKDDLITIFLCSSPFLFSVILMILIQLLSPCKNVCFSTDRTLLDVENLHKNHPFERKSFPHQQKCCKIWTNAVFYFSSTFNPCHGIHLFLLGHSEPQLESVLSTDKRTDVPRFHYMKN